MRQGAVSTVLSLSDVISLLWYHEGAALRFTDEEKNFRDLKVLLEALKDNKAYINDIIVGLEQFGAVWQFV